MVARMAERLGLRPRDSHLDGGRASERGLAGARARGALRSHGRLLPCARHSGARHRASPRRSGRDLPHAAQARQRARRPCRHPRGERVVRHRRAAASARHAEGQACRHARPRRVLAGPRIRAIAMSASSVHACALTANALAKLGLTPEALARSARRLRRARAALDAAAQTFLATHGVMSEAGYCLIERAALIAAPEEIALRALARSVNAVSGRESPLQLGKLESLLEGLSENPKAAHTLGGCRLQPLGGRLGVFRETRRNGTAFAPARSRGTRAVGQPLRRRASERRISAGNGRGPRRGALARSSRLSALARRAAALRRRDAACVLRWGPDPGSDSRPGCRCGG